MTKVKKKKKGGDTARAILNADVKCIESAVGIKHRTLQRKGLSKSDREEKQVIIKSKAKGEHREAVTITDVRIL